MLSLPKSKFKNLPIKKARSSLRAFSFLLSHSLYNLGSDKMVLDKQLMKRIEEIEALPETEKEKIFDYIDLVIRDTKIKRAHAA